jgi:hypothetical protein
MVNKFRCVLCGKEFDCLTRRLKENMMVAFKRVYGRTMFPQNRDNVLLSDIDFSGEVYSMGGVAGHLFCEHGFATFNGCFCSEVDGLYEIKEVDEIK